MTISPTAAQLQPGFDSAIAGMSSSALGGITSGTSSARAAETWVPQRPTAKAAAARPERRRLCRVRIMALAFLGSLVDSAIAGQRLAGSEGCTEFHGRKR